LPTVTGSLSWSGIAARQRMTTRRNKAASTLPPCRTSAYPPSGGG
jgi:hypothetical protein